MNTKVKEFWKEHKKEILIGTGVVVCGVVGVKFGLDSRKKKNYPYKVICKTDNKDFADALDKVINYRAGEASKGAYLSWGSTAEEVMNSVSEFIAESENCEYNLVLEKFEIK